MMDTVLEDSVANKIFLPTTGRGIARAGGEPDGAWSVEALLEDPPGEPHGTDTLQVQEQRGRRGGRGLQAEQQQDGRDNSAADDRPGKPRQVCAR